jgi:hypothetical protein
MAGGDLEPPPSGPPRLAPPVWGPPPRLGPPVWGPLPGQVESGAPHHRAMNEHPPLKIHPPSPTLFCLVAP